MTPLLWCVARGRLLALDGVGGVMLQSAFAGGSSLWLSSGTASISVVTVVTLGGVHSLRRDSGLKRLTEAHTEPSPLGVTTATTSWSGPGLAASGAS